MPGKYKFRTSRLAIWALWLSRLAIPVALLAFLLMRFGGLHPSYAVYCFGTAVALALLSVLFSLGAFPAIWFEGAIGGRRLWGTFLRSLVIMLPALAFAYFYNAIPAFSDLSTNPVDPPEFTSAWDLREEGDNELGVASLSAREQQALAYPELESMAIEQPADLLYLLVLDELEKEKWQLLDYSDQRDSANGSHFEATSRSAITGLRYVISVRLRPEGEEKTLMDIRSASLWGPHDFGMNARYIKTFTEAVETRLGESVAHFELQLEEQERERRLKLGPMPRPKPPKDD